MKRSNSGDDSQTKRKRRGSRTSSYSDIRSTLKKIADASKYSKIVHETFHLDLAAVSMTEQAVTMVRIPLKFSTVQADVVEHLYNETFLDGYINGVFSALGDKKGYALIGSAIETDGCYNKNKKVSNMYICDINSKFGIIGLDRPLYEMCVSPKDAERFFTAFCAGRIQSETSGDSHSFLSVLHALCTVTSDEDDPKWEILEDCLFDDFM